MENVLKAYRFELLPTKEQCLEFDKQIASCRHTWNAMLALDTNKHRNYYISNPDKLQDYINNLTKVEELKNSYAKYLVDNPNPTFEQKLDFFIPVVETKLNCGEFITHVTEYLQERIKSNTESLSKLESVDDNSKILAKKLTTKIESDNKNILDITTVTKKYSKLTLAKFLTILRSYENYEWMSTCPRLSQNAVVMNYYESWNKYFKYLTKLKKGDKNHRVGKPKFRKYKDVSSFKTSYGDDIKLENLDDRKSLLHITGCDPIRLIRHREPKGILRSGTIVREYAGKYYVSLLYSIDDYQPISQKTEKEIAIDLGVKTLVVQNDGHIYENKSKQVSADKKLAKIQRELALKTKGSKSRRKVIAKLRKAHRKVKNIRTDYLHKVSRELVNNYDVIYTENLNNKEMIEKGTKSLSKSLQESSFGKFVTMLEYKSREDDKRLIKVNTYFPSSKLCSNCGHKNTELTLNDREWDCPICNEHHDRDLNAAKNIFKEGVRIKNSKESSK